MSNKNIIKEHNNLSNTNTTMLSKATDNMQILDDVMIIVQHALSMGKTERKFTMINEDYK